MPPNPVPRVLVRQNQSNANRFLFDFDLAAPGGRGGASVKFDPSYNLVSIDSVHKNVLLRRRSTGRLLAEGLGQTPFSKPAILEAYNVERTTANNLAAGGDGRATLIGNLLEDTTAGLGGSILYWMPVPAGGVWHLRVFISYP